MESSWIALLGGAAAAVVTKSVDYVISKNKSKAEISLEDKQQFIKDNADFRAELRADLEKVKAECTALETKVDCLRKEKINLEEEVLRLRAENQSLREEITTLKDKNKNLQERNSGFDSRIKELEQELIRLRKVDCNGQ